MKIYQPSPSPVSAKRRNSKTTQNALVYHLVSTIWTKAAIDTEHIRGMPHLLSLSNHFSHLKLTCIQCSSTLQAFQLSLSNLNTVPIFSKQEVNVCIGLSRTTLLCQCTEISDDSILPLLNLINFINPIERWRIKNEAFVKDRTLGRGYYGK